MDLSSLLPLPSRPPYIDFEFVLDGFLEPIKIGVAPQHREVVAMRDKLKVVSRVLEAGRGGDTRDETKSPQGSAVCFLP